MKMQLLNKAHTQSQNVSNFFLYHVKSTTIFSFIFILFGVIANRAFVRCWWWQWFGTGFVLFLVHYALTSYALSLRCLEV